MKTITLNSTELTFAEFSRHTDIIDGQPKAYIMLMFNDNSQYYDLVHVGVINSISVEIDGTVVYSMNNITANITNVNENLMEDGSIRMDATIYMED